MPTYSYACTECDNKFDAVQAFTDDALTTCPECSGRLRKLFNSVGVVFKGSGFYRTDSRDGGSSAPGSSAPGSSAPGSSDKSSDKSSAAKSSDSTASSTSGSKEKPASTSTAAAASS